jgi:hypothetical protein
VSEYVVAIKPSARRTCGTVGEWVNRHGSRRGFASKALARQWTRRASGYRARVWVQDAAPHDDADVDGYVVGGDRPGAAGADASAGEQALVDRFG